MMPILPQKRGYFHTNITFKPGQNDENAIILSQESKKAIYTLPEIKDIDNTIIILSL